MEQKNIRRECEELWAKNKYYVLSKSQKAYLEIREYLKQKELDVLWLNEKIQETIYMKESKKNLVMPFFTYGNISKKMQVKLKNRYYLMY